METTKANTSCHGCEDNNSNIESGDHNSESLIDIKNLPISKLDEKSMRNMIKADEEVVLPQIHGEGASLFQLNDQVLEVYTTLSDDETLNNANMEQKVQPIIIGKDANFEEEQLTYQKVNEDVQANGEDPVNELPLNEATEEQEEALTVENVEIIVQLNAGDIKEETISDEDNNNNTESEKQPDVFNIEEKEKHSHGERTDTEIEA